MSVAVSDSSVLIHLAAIGRLNLLKYYFDEVIVSPAVWREVVVQGGTRYGVDEVISARKSGWIKMISPHDKSLVREFEHDLHSGESESIVLALELHPDAILIDETEARSCAHNHDLTVTGCIGILLQAKDDRKVRSIRAELDRLKRQGNFWISKPLYREILAWAKEREQK
ncbi:MAG: DUF3368 domain-containing protein [Methanoregula sp.]|jgi:hypothetical protein